MLPRSFSCFTLLTLSLLAACSSSHAPVDDAGAPGLDAARLEDAAMPPLDGAPLRACALASLERTGEPCFCRGPIARYGDVLYRKSYGLEVWDLADPARPALVPRMDDEPPTSGGSLAIVGAHLVSVGDSSPALHVYDLSDPRRPRRVASAAIEGAPMDAVASGSMLAIATYVADAAQVTFVDLSVPSEPRVRGVLPLAGQPGRLAIGGDRLFAITAEPLEPEQPVWLHVIDPTRGVVLARHRIASDGDWLGRAIATSGDLVLLTGMGAPLTVMRVSVEEASVLARIEEADTYVTSIVVHGSLVLASDGEVRIFDLADPSRPRELGRATQSIGDAWALGTDATFSHAYVSNGNGLLPVSLRCE